MNRIIIFSIGIMLTSAAFAQPSNDDLTALIGATQQVQQDTQIVLNLASQFQTLQNNNWTYTDQIGAIITVDGGAQTILNNNLATAVSNLQNDAANITPIALEAILQGGSTTITGSTN